MKVKFGASILSWIPPVWTPAGGLYAIEQTALAGFDLLEILLPTSMEFEAAAVKKQLAYHQLGAVCSLNLPPACHIPAYPAQATALIKRALEKAAGLEVDFLGGVLHGGIGAFSGQPRTPEEETIVCEVWAEVALYAQQLGITIGIEPINRYESYMCNTAEDTLALINRVNMPNLVLHLDTFHMNIEESNFYDPVLAAGSKLKHLHMTESHRGMLGEGNVNWDKLFQGLSAIDFEGNLVLENFTSAVPGMAAAVSLWRPSTYTPHQLATQSLHFMQEMVAKYAK